MIKEYDKRDLMKNFLKSKLSIAPLRTTLEINGEIFHVPAREYYITNEAAASYYNYVHAAVKNDSTLDTFFKILTLQSWPMSYIPGRKEHEMYSFLRSHILNRMTEYNIVYVRLVKKKPLKDGEITVIRTHIIGRNGTEPYFDYSTSPLYTFNLDGREYMVPSSDVAPILTKINERAPKKEIIELLTSTKQPAARRTRRRKSKYL